MEKNTLEDRAIYLRICGIACGACGHSWGDHRLGAFRDIDEDLCQECSFEEVHQERESGAVCALAVPLDLLAAPPSMRELEAAIPHWTRWRLRQRDRLSSFTKRFRRDGKSSHNS
jgi:hypothetical protein